MNEAKSYIRVNLMFTRKEVKKIFDFLCDSKLQIEITISSAQSVTGFISVSVYGKPEDIVKLIVKAHQ